MPGLRARARCNSMTACSNFPCSKEPLAREAYLRDLRALSQRANVFVKGSEVLRRIDGTVSTDLSNYRAWLDEIWDIFGSDWPNSDQMATFVRIHLASFGSICRCGEAQRRRNSSGETLLRPTDGNRAMRRNHNCLPYNVQELSMPRQIHLGKRKADSLT